jgi:hypothetical protein
MAAIPIWMLDTQVDTKCKSERGSFILITNQKKVSHTSFENQSHVLLLILGRMF